VVAGGATDRAGRILRGNPRLAGVAGGAVSRGARERSVPATPLAMAALDVAGQVRERSPADLAIFGEDAARLVDRFADRDVGQELLARAVTDGSAEREALLVTTAGTRHFRVGLWRQRGGDRIRVLAVFSLGPAGVPGGAELTGPLRRAIARAASDLRGPLDAVLGFAELIRSTPRQEAKGAASAHADEILAAAWRLMRVAADLDLVGRFGSGAPGLRPAEVDIVRLARRVAGLAAPAARAAGIALETGDLPRPGAGPLVLADEGALWSALDTLLRRAIRLGGPGGQIALVVEGDDEGVALKISGSSVEPDPDALAEPSPQDRTDLDACREFAAANGARLETDAGPCFSARLVFPAARCLSPV